ncbi:elicitor-responsive protein 3-like isoform X1 [Phragmites australis]|uniref:elicitor-responsive protein 3-like isoform X1 n=1 Tax=Phragmites australis TaxID=29695 RepID=UPI002D76CD50|nr:elicitor-responsive protein 3-like isoform X1 [Phragmites australis]
MRVSKARGQASAYKGQPEFRISSSTSPFVRATGTAQGPARRGRRRRWCTGRWRCCSSGPRASRTPITSPAGNMDPYAILKCRSQEQRSSIATGKGSNPEWNESFVFTVSDRTTDLLVKLMDSDTGTADDFVGEATIPLEAVYTERNIPPTLYNVVKGEKYCGEIKIGLTFTPEDARQRGLPEDVGGWKQSH